jgi:predicted RNA-binding protein with EMAP domain
MPQTSNRQNCHRKLMQGKGTNVEEQRIKRRKCFVERFKSLRIQAIDKFRDLSESDLDYGSLLELKKHILSSLNTKELVDVQEMTELLEDVKNELELYEVEQYERQCLEEIESVADSLMNKCAVCDSLVLEAICDSCAQEHFTSQF